MRISSKVVKKHGFRQRIKKKKKNRKKDFCQETSNLRKDNLQISSIDREEAQNLSMNHRKNSNFV